MPFDFDIIIIGSGFGGSVSALRLAEKGYSVCVLERGKRFLDSEFPKTNWDLRRYLWAPLFKCFGIQNLSLFKHILVLSGCGVGGGSLVYANTLLEPSDPFYDAPSWSAIASWKTELAPHYLIAKKMLGVVPNPKLTQIDQILYECSKEIGKEQTFKPSNVGVFFGEPGKTVKDPFFEGKGPDRQGCTFCGGCMVGCRHNAKNTLTKNYLHLAERLGVKIIPERTVDSIRPIDGGYEVTSFQSTSWLKVSRTQLRSRKVILAAGVLGTVNLLLKCKHIDKSLPKLSDRLGSDVRTNSEAITAATTLGPPQINCSDGIAISSIFHPDDHTHIEPVRYPKNSDFMRLLAVPMSDEKHGVPRILRFFRLVFRRDWASSTIILLTMQSHESKIRFKLGRDLFTFFRKRMTTQGENGRYKIPTFIPIANQIGRAFAKKLNAVPQSALNEVFLGIPTTAHILGGCVIGESHATGVVDQNHEVFGYPGLYICDGSVIPANLGVNPSLTITALTERAMHRIPANAASAQKIR